MATTIWKGHITFGLVSFPVRLQAAARSQAVSFNQLHQCDHSRVKQVLYCQTEDKPVSRSELVKGFEYEKDRYVVVEERLAEAEGIDAKDAAALLRIDRKRKKKTSNEDWNTPSDEGRSRRRGWLPLIHFCHACRSASKPLD